MGDTADAAVGIDRVHSGR